MRPVLKLMAAVCGLAAIGLLFILLMVWAGVAWALRPPPTPAVGFQGDWRPTNRWGTLVERPLPKASAFATEFAAWKEARQVGVNAFYVARLGGTFRQSHWEVSNFKAELPLGTHTYTTASFLYRDETNGTYRLTWTMRGRHDCGFLRMDERVRGYYLLPGGADDDAIPTLSIEAIEGVTPFEQ